ncbi:hypothetical protein CEP53_005354 [Fusarium sp. AF-6]|nr:hypothetical protein CEP53_005354 [Fusarium sp. AF-6]
MDPPGSNAEPEEFDYSLLDFDPDSLLDAWVEDLVVAGDHSAQHDRPVATPPDNIFSNMDTSFGGDDSAFDFGLLDHFQISDMPQDCVPGLDLPMTDLPGVDPFSMLDPSVLQHPDFMDFQFGTGSGQNPPGDVTMEDLTSSSCTNLGDLQEEAANVGNGIVFPLQTSVPIGSSEFVPQTHDSSATRHIEHFEGQLTNAPGASQHAPPTSFTPLSILPQAVGPDILTRRQLPPKRRGGRRASRYLELRLFQYLQVISNKTSFNSVEDRKSYIMTIFSVLLFSASYTQSTHEDAMDEKDPGIIHLYREAFDRRSRVQSALWVYCSIAVRGLPAWTNIWETVQLSWPFIQVETIAQQFHKSATAFNKSLSDARESIFHSRDRFLD